MAETEFQDKLLTCVDCQAQFVFSARDQAFYQERGYQNPRRCKTCRMKKNKGVPGGPAKWAHPSFGGDENLKPEFADTAAGETPAPAAAAQYKVICSACGAEATVNFKPNPTRPVYCRNCFATHRSSVQKQ